MCSHLVYHGTVGAALLGGGLLEQWHEVIRQVAVPMQQLHSLPRRRRHRAALGATHAQHLRVHLAAAQHRRLPEPRVTRQANGTPEGGAQRARQLEDGCPRRGVGVVRDLGTVLVQQRDGALACHHSARLLHLVAVVAADAHAPAFHLVLVRRVLLVTLVRGVLLDRLGHLLLRESHAHHAPTYISLPGDSYACKRVRRVV
jgi:hypothetical protein